MCSDSVRNSLISFNQVCSLALNVLQRPLVGCLPRSKAPCVWSLRIQSVTISLFKCECWKTKLRSWCVYSEVIECVLHTPRITLTTCQLECFSEQFYETVPKSKCKSKDNTMIILCAMTSAHWYKHCTMMSCNAEDTWKGCGYAITWSRLRLSKNSTTVSLHGQREGVVSGCSFACYCVLFPPDNSTAGLTPGPPRALLPG